MNDNLPDVINGGQAEKMSRKNAPPLGQWRWIREENGSESLMCAYHLASNHVVFYKSSPGGGTSGYRIYYKDLEKETRVEPNWKDVLQKQIADKQKELSSAIQSMIDLVKNADLLQDANQPETLLPSTSRRDPVLMKKTLTELKEKSYPEAHQKVEDITKQMVALQKDLCLQFKAEAERMDKAVKTVDKKLFALEIYAGIGEGAKLIRNGKEALPETPISVRQMMRFMDEETLIDYDKGGMDFTKVQEFDRWIAKPENINRIAPEQRCVVALQVRRNMKDYGSCNSIGEAIQHIEWHKANTWTYLLIRNGEKIWRLICDIEFSPRLLPLRDEFVKPLVERSWGGFGQEDKEEIITPEHLDYDKHLEERMNRVYECNRVMFLLQGLLDRSKVFSPHPPINLADPDHVEKYFKAIFDEETGLPSANPPNWNDYKNTANAKLKVGDFVHCVWYPDEAYSYCRHRQREILKDNRTRPDSMCKVHHITKDRKWVWLRWEKGEKIKTEWVIDRSRPVPNKPGYYYQRKVEHNLGMKYGMEKVPMEECFNVSAYKSGDYKPFLCDAYLKGAYLEWAPQLLGAEKWLRKH